LGEALDERERGISDFASVAVDGEPVLSAGHLHYLSYAVVMAL